MHVKTFEVRDRATFIPVMAVYVDVAIMKRVVADLESGVAKNEDGVDLLPVDIDQLKADAYLLHRAGYGPSGGPYVLLTNLTVPRTEHDPFSWGGPSGARTLTIAHRHIRDNWDDLPSGAVVDVEYVLGETKSPKVSDR